MPFKVSDIKVTINAKRIINLFKLLILYRFQIGKTGYHYFLAFWFVFSIKGYWFNIYKSSPYLRIKEAFK